MTQRPVLTRRQTLLRYLGCYAAYFVLLALGYVVVFMIWRQTMITLLAVAGVTRAFDALYMLSMILLGGGLFILVLAAEPYLRAGIATCQLRRRITRMVVPLGIAGLLGILLQVVLLTFAPAA